MTCTRLRQSVSRACPLARDVAVPRAGSPLDGMGVACQCGGTGPRSVNCLGGGTRVDGRVGSGRGGTAWFRSVGSVHGTVLHASSFFSARGVGLDDQDRSWDAGAHLHKHGSERTARI